MHRSLSSVVGLLGGVGHIVQKAMREDGMWERFHTVLEREYSLAFGDAPLPGEDLAYALPTITIPTAPLGNFTSC